MPTCYQRLSKSSEARQSEQFPAVNPAPTAGPEWTATPVTLSLAILFVAWKAKKGDCGHLAAERLTEGFSPSKQPTRRYVTVNERQSSVAMMDDIDCEAS